MAVIECATHALQGNKCVCVCGGVFTEAGYIRQFLMGENIIDGYNCFEKERSLAIETFFT